MKALLLLAFGGPRSLDEVEGFLTRLYKGQKPSHERLEQVKKRYRMIGGGSPLPDMTLKQAGALEALLVSRGFAFKTYVGMRYGHPLIEETFKKILQDGLHEVIALPMTPFRSPASTEAYIEEVTRISEALEKEVDVSFVEGWHRHPLFIEALREKIKEAFAVSSPEERKKTALVFTAHSLPISFIKDSSYVKDIEESVRDVLKGFARYSWKIAFQSRGMGQGEWLGPDVETVLNEFSQKKIKNVLMVPIGFVADHIEILYDIDVLYRQKAEALGMNLKRTTSLNDSKKFIEALAAVVEERMKESLE